MSLDNEDQWPLPPVEGAPHDGCVWLVDRPTGWENRKEASEVNGQSPENDGDDGAASHPRMRLTPGRLPSEHIDGAWWPRTPSLADELPSLLSALSDRLGRAVMVGYRENGWTDAPPTLEIDGSMVHLVGFVSDEPASVIVIGHDGHHVTLRVIAPQTADREAEQALNAIRQHGEAGEGSDVGSGVARSIADVAKRLASHEGSGDEQRAAQIQRWCAEAAERFDEAPVQAFVPILVEHIVRNRMSNSRLAPVPGASR